MEWIDLGYFGLFLATFLAATIIPFSSEAVVVGMLAVGFDPIGVVSIATIGNTLGGMSSYYLGYLGDWHWIETKLGVKHERVMSLKHWVDRYGSFTAFFCWLPFVGDVFAVALGFFKTNTWIVLTLMTLGKLLRYVAVYWGWEMV